MKLNEIIEMWEKDNDITPSKIGKISLETPKVTSKYLKILADERHLLNKMTEKQNILVRKKREYYLGQASAEDYKEKPFNLKLLKNDVPLYINSDDEIIKLNLQISQQNEKVEFLKSIITILNNRKWEIKNYLDHMKFMYGEK